MELTRRHALAGAAALAAAPVVPATTANAAAPVAGKQNASFYRYKVGDAEVTVVSDGASTFPLPETFVLNAKKDDVNAALEKAFRPRDKMTIQFGPLVMRAPIAWAASTKRISPWMDCAPTPWTRTTPSVAARAPSAMK